MSSGEQRLKTKQELLDEYEKDYLVRLKEKKPGDLQNVILQFAKEVKSIETKDYIGVCVGCNKGITRNNLVFKKGKTFHPDCYSAHGNEFPDLPADLADVTRTKVELVLLRNLKARQEAVNPTKSATRRKKTVVRKRSTRKKRSLRRKAKKRKTVLRKRRKKGRRSQRKRRR